MRYAGLALAFVGSWCFAFAGPMAKYLIEAGLEPMEAVWTRMAGAGLLLVAVLAVVRPRALRIPSSKLPFLGLYAVMGVAGVQSLYFVAITRLPVGVALLLEFMAPVMVVAWVRVVRRVRLAGAAYVGAVVAIAGLAIVVEAWQGLRIDALGLLLGLLAGACCAGYFLMCDGFGDDIDPLGLIAWGLLGAAVLLLPFSRPWNIPWEAFTVSATPEGAVTLPVLGAYLCMAVVGTSVAYIVSMYAVRRLSAAVGATVASLEVIAGAVLAWALVGETLGVFQIVGGLIVLSGALLAQTATASVQSAAQSAAGPGPVAGEPAEVTAPG
ncbi:EamA family transporter [Nonomuraea sp. KC401]|uniref:EamA family transporter n=1 Tax=unclassified Nonomuraea TaxID=2593643 RepID=UPI0010FD9867|nr:MULTISPECIES: EamA family transporter [unclassified Nonomuraea]NBE95975.1 EamA family transporter [Nonomuraea sp. K271]TLF65970.1 EamA family transporter [Nonomuraea sp. KC401]